MYWLFSISQVAMSVNRLRLVKCWLHVLADLVGPFLSTPPLRSEMEEWMTAYVEKTLVLKRVSKQPFISILV